MNWGNKLLIVFGVFGAGMTFLVYRCMQTEFELVEKDYYKTELAYQQVIDASRRSEALGSRAKISETAEGQLRLQLPDEMKGRALRGQVWFYCAYNAALDKKLSLELNEEAWQQFAAGTLLPGSYTAKISWEDGLQQYYYETPLRIQ